MTIEELGVPAPGVVVLNAMRCGGEDTRRNELCRADHRPFRRVEVKLASPVERSRRDIAGQARERARSTVRGPSGVPRAGLRFGGPRAEAGRAPAQAWRLRPDAGCRSSIR